MKTSLSQNICRLRRENGMTQEQLAEALGVSFAAVSKWERGAATPELGLIVDMADLFDLSLDALVGYESRDNSRAATVERLRGYVHDRQAEGALQDAEKALQRYPNCFEAVYYSAAVYQVRGVCQNEPALLRRALSLYHRASRLLPQNRDAEISELSLWRELAEVHLALDEWERGVELLKAHNACRLNHPLIGKTLASSGNDTRGALPYLSLGLLDLSVAQMQVVIGFVNVYIKAGDYRSALDILEWAAGFFSGLRRPGRACCIDKGEAALRAIMAYAHMQLGSREEAARCLRDAKRLALGFDAEPRYDAASLRFVAEGTVASEVDDLGPSAAEGVSKVVSDFGCEQFSRLWQEARDEG